MKVQYLAMGPNVCLREFTKKDAAEFIRMAKASYDLHSPWIKIPDSRQAFEAYLAGQKNGLSLKAFAVCQRKTGVLVGGINLREIVRGSFHSAYSSYFVHKEWARQGLMQEALWLLIRHAFGSLGLHRLEANIQPKNTASINLVKNCGFLREGYSPRYLKIRGRWRDHERWAIVKGMQRPNPR